MFPQMKYIHIERLLTIIEERFNVDNPQSLIVNNLNPILGLLNVLSALNMVEERFGIAQFRCDYINDVIEKQVRSIFVNLYMPVEIRAQVK